MSFVTSDASSTSSLVNTTAAELLVGTIVSSSSSVLQELVEEHGKSLLWLVGAVCAAFGAIGQNLGVNTQKYAFMQNTTKPVEEQIKSPLKMPLWLLGLTVVVIGAICDFVALGFAAQSVVAPIGSLTLVANIFFAHFWLGEHLTKKDIFGTACIVVGAVVAAAFGDHTEIAYTVEMLQDFWLSPIFLSYMGVLCIIMAGLFVMVKKIEPIRSKMTETQTAYGQALAQQDQEALVLQDQILSVIEVEYAQVQKYHSFGYCCLSGLFGGQNILFGKMVAELMGATLAGDSQLGKPFTYIMAVCMGVTIVAQLHFLAKGLANFDALYVVPIYRCFFIIISTLGGGLFFREFWRFKLYQWLVFVPAILLTVFGVVLLSQRAEKEKDVRDPYQFKRYASLTSMTITNANDLEPCTMGDLEKNRTSVLAWNKVRKSVFARNLNMLEQMVDAAESTRPGTACSIKSMTDVDGGGTILDTLFMSGKVQKSDTDGKSSMALSIPKSLQKKISALQEQDSERKRENLTPKSGNLSTGRRVRLGSRPGSRPRTNESQGPKSATRQADETIEGFMAAEKARQAAQEAKNIQLVDNLLTTGINQPAANNDKLLR